MGLRLKSIKCKNLLCIPHPKLPSKESVARAKAFLDDHPVVDG